MTALKAKQRYEMARGETRTTYMDWGENTSGQEHGVLKDGDTVASCTAAILSGNKPTGADDLTLGSVTAPNSTTSIRGRTASSGEWTKLTVTSAADQAYGTYEITLTATTTNSEVIKRNIIVIVNPL